MWKLREELVQALEELNLLEDVFIPVNEELESIVLEEGNTEGRIVMYYTTKYERSQKNRNNAVKIHGLSCCVCDFNFENFYGALGKNYIEVHHLKPLYSRDEEVIPNVETDLVCLCSNCHRMLHRSKSDIMTPDELKFIIKENL